jgi:hypothetical protein
MSTLSGSRDPQTTLIPISIHPKQDFLSLLPPFKYVDGRGQHLAENKQDYKYAESTVSEVILLKPKLI